MAVLGGHLDIVQHLLSPEVGASADLAGRDGCVTPTPLLQWLPLTASLF